MALGVRRRSKFIVCISMNLDFVVFNLQVVGTLLVSCIFLSCKRGFVSVVRV